MAARLPSARPPSARLPSARLPSEARQRQLVQAALELAATEPVRRITTGRVAAHVGISQPAVFRHFKSRDDLLVAVVAHVQQALGRRLERALALRQAPVDRVVAYVSAVATYACEHPGAPRLLFQDVRGDTPEALSRALHHLHQTQRQVVGWLLGQARLGLVDAGDPSDAAARGVIALLQGAILQWQVDPWQGDRVADIERFVRTWCAGLDRLPAAPPLPPPPERVDARQVVQQGDSPVPIVMSAASALPPGGSFLFVAPFRPGPLVGLLCGAGFQVDEAPGRPWQATVRRLGKSQ